MASPRTRTRNLSARVRSKSAGPEAEARPGLPPETLPPHPGTPAVNRPNASYWEARYQTRDIPWEKGAPSPGLVDFLAANHTLTRGAVCVPGCGTGHDVREWARAGFDAFGCDIAPSAIRLATARTRASGLRAAFRRLDFLVDAPPALFDWVFEHTLFCAIQPDQRDDYVRALLRWLKPKGQYLAVNYLIPDRDGPPFGTTRDELWKRFSPHFQLLKESVPRSYPNRTGLELMLWWRRGECGSHRS
jgi:methyl halide transferase